MGSDWITQLSRFVWFGCVQGERLVSFLFPHPSIQSKGCPRADGISNRCADGQTYQTTVFGLFSSTISRRLPFDWVVDGWLAGAGRGG